jgi:hypothetical protein
MTRPLFRIPDPAAAAGISVAGAPTRLLTALTVLFVGPAEIRGLLAAYRSEIMGSHNNATGNRNLTDEGIRATKAADAARISAHYQQLAATQRARINSATNTIDTATAAAMPKPTAGVEALLMRQGAWARTRSMLDAGISPHQLISEAANADTLVMLAEELPAYLRIGGADADTVTAYLSAVDLQYASIVGEPAASVLRLDAVADCYEQALAILLDGMDVEVSGKAQPGVGFSSAVAAGLLFQQRWNALTGTHGDLDSAGALIDTGRDGSWAEVVAYQRSKVAGE